MVKGFSFHSLLMDNLHRSLAQLSYLNDIREVRKVVPAGVSSRHSLQIIKAPVQEGLGIASFVLE